LLGARALATAEKGKFATFYLKLAWMFVSLMRHFLSLATVAMVTKKTTFPWLS